VDSGDPLDPPQLSLSIEALPALLRGIQPRADAQLVEAAGIESVSRCPALRHLMHGRLTYKKMQRLGIA